MRRKRPPRLLSPGGGVARQLLQAGAQLAHPCPWSQNWHALFYGWLCERWPDVGERGADVPFSPPQLTKNKKGITVSVTVSPKRPYRQQAGFGDRGKRLPGEADYGGGPVFLFSWGLPTKQRHWLSESGWCVLCFPGTWTSMLSQQDWDGALDSCPWSITAELQNRGFMWRPPRLLLLLHNSRYKDCLLPLNCEKRRRTEKWLSAFIRLI